MEKWLFYLLLRNLLIILKYMIKSLAFFRHLKIGYDFNDFVLLAEIEAIEACKWLRAAGFPQYAQMYEGKYDAATGWTTNHMNYETKNMNSFVSENGFIAINGAKNRADMRTQIVSVLQNPSNSALTLNCTVILRHLIVFRDHVESFN